MASALSLVEPGWHVLRTCSLDLSRQGIAVTHLIKGSLGAEIRGMIQPQPLMRIVDVPRPLFKAALWLVLVAGTLSGRLRWVLTDSERTLKAVAGWCRQFRLTLVYVEGARAGYLLRREGQVVPFERVFGTI